MRHHTLPLPRAKKLPESGAIFRSVDRPSRGDATMWKLPAAILGCCLAALPLIGCAGGVTALRQDGAPVPTAAATPSEGVYATGAAMPAAILVFVPGMNALSRDDFLSRDPALWAAQGVDVVMRQPSWSTRLIADQEAALERLLASARSLAGSCSRTLYYSTPGNGTEPKMVVKTSGDACGASPPLDARRAPSGAVPVPQVKPGAPRIIETSIPADRTAQQPFVQRLAEEIKAPPSS